MPKIHVALPPEVHKQLRVKVALEDETIQDYVEGLVTRAVQDVRIDVDERRKPNKARREIS